MSNITSATANPAVNQTQDNNRTEKKSSYGKTIGEPQLSEKAAKYYESLKGKFGNMDFILVSKEEKEMAKANAAKYANPNKMVVLIDEEKLEKMATDESYRKKYEGIIAQSASGMSDFAKKLSGTGANIKGFGMQVNDNGTASYFAVLKKSSDDQKVRIEKAAEKKKAAKKAEAKKEAKKAEKERLQKTHGDDKVQKEDDEVTITASSVEELLQKIQDTTQLLMSDSVQTESEKQVGQNFDFSV